jgi:hypothetical protein
MEADEVGSDASGGWSHNMFLQSCPKRNGGRHRLWHSANTQLRPVDRLRAGLKNSKQKTSPF